MPALPYARYLDRVLGAWLGAFAGATVAAPFAGRKDLSPVRFDKKSPGRMTANDCLALALLNLHALKERGPHWTMKGLMEEWGQHFTSDAAEFGIARRNWRVGIQPPASGRHNNEFFGESASAAARAFAWGLVSPGAPKIVIRYARRDAELDHNNDGIEAAMFFAALVSGLFFETDIETLVHTSLHQVDGGSRLARMVRDVLRWTSEKHHETTVARIRSRYSTPDDSRVHVNTGLLLASLLHAKAEFDASLLAVAACGHGAACNGLLAGAIAGGLCGAARLPEKWKKALGAGFDPGDTVRDLPCDGRFETLAEETCRLGMEIASVFETGTEFAPVPSTITVIEHNPQYLRVMDVFVEYPGAPTLRFGDERELRLKIVSRNPRRMQGVFRLETKSDLRLRPDAIPLDIGPYETRTIDVKVAFAEKTQRLPMANLVTARFEVGKESIHSESFGIAGSALWLAIGPFWSDPKAKPAAWTNAFGRLSGFEVKWLPEPDVDEKTKPTGKRFFERVLVHADGDAIPLDHVFPPTGPCTLYLVARLHSPVDRKALVWLGSSDPVRLWVNRKLVADGAAHGFFTPFNHVEEIHLRKGPNRLLLKAAREDRHFSLRIGFKEHRRGDSFASPWLSDLAYEPLTP